DHRLCAGGASAPGAAATAVNRLHLADWLCADGAGRKPDRVHWSAGCPCDVQATSGDRVRTVSADGGAPLPGQPHHRMRLSPTLSMIFPENRFPPRIKSGAGFFGIMLYG